MNPATLESRIHGLFRSAKLGSHNQHYAHANSSSLIGTTIPIPGMPQSGSSVMETPSGDNPMIVSCSSNPGASSLVTSGNSMPSVNRPADEEVIREKSSSAIDPMMVEYTEVVAVARASAGEKQSLPPVPADGGAKKRRKRSDAASTVPEVANMFKAYKGSSSSPTVASSLKNKPVPASSDTSEKILDAIPQDTSDTSEKTLDAIPRETNDVVTKKTVKGTFEAGTAEKKAHSPPAATVLPPPAVNASALGLEASVDLLKPVISPAELKFAQELSPSGRLAQESLYLAKLTNCLWASAVVNGHLEESNCKLCGDVSRLTNEKSAFAAEAKEAEKRLMKLAAELETTKEKHVEESKEAADKLKGVMKEKENLALRLDQVEEARVQAEEARAEAVAKAKELQGMVDGAVEKYKKSPEYVENLAGGAIYILDEFVSLLKKEGAAPENVEALAARHKSNHFAAELLAEDEEYEDDGETASFVDGDDAIAVVEPLLLAFF